MRDLVPIPVQLWLADSDGWFLGTVLLGPCLKPNGRHRAEVMMLLAYRSVGGQGVTR